MSISERTVAQLAAMTSRSFCAADSIFTDAFGSLVAQFFGSPSVLPLLMESRHFATPLAVVLVSFWAALLTEERQL